MTISFSRSLPALAALALVAGCGGTDEQAIPQLAAATGAALTSCTDLTTRISLANTVYLHTGSEDD